MNRSFEEFEESPVVRFLDEYSPVTEGCKRKSKNAPMNQQQFSQMATRLQETVDGMISESKTNTDALAIENKANTEEFLNVINMIVRGSSDSCKSDNSSPGNSIVHDGEILLELVAGPEPSKFGRVLARKLFGSHQDCKLMNEIIGKPGLQRSPCDVTLRNKFEEVVRRKYPRAPSYAVADAIKGANQMGLEFRREYMAEK